MLPNKILKVSNSTFFVYIYIYIFTNFFNTKSNQSKPIFFFVLFKIQTNMSNFIFKNQTKQIDRLG